MDALETNSSDEFIKESPSSNLLSADDIVETDDCGDPPIPPRIGDEYQVALPPGPPLRGYGNYEILQELSHGNETVVAERCFRIGLGIPICWFPIQKQNEGNKSNCLQGSKEAVPRTECSLLANNYSPWRKSGHMHVDQQILLSKVRFNNDEAHSDIKSPRTVVVKEKHTPLPDRMHSSWADSEIESFLLGLYIFGKNLFLVGKFMEDKGMGDILSFYYGKFYLSDAYRRWSECRKTKSRKYIQGQRIFTGWRQQELLSRLFRAIPEECRNALAEATRGFSEGTVLFEDYVFRLRTIVGMKALVEAVAIGKGKCDLTGYTLDPAKTNIVPTCRPDIPVGKACSTLSSAEIVSFLTGDFRMSKARSNDLFWEAVWPRLLARGWHSEQPKNRQCPKTRQALVFLVPGVEKFSRRKLLKGIHYYDSATDVLNKVATDPKLLELDTEGSLCATEENAHALEPKVDQNNVVGNVPAEIPRSTSELMKFTIVDTSLVQGEAPHKITELRTLPVDSSYKYSNLSMVRDSFSSSDESHSSSTSCSDDQQEEAELSLDSRASEKGLFGSGTRKKSSIMFADPKLRSDHSDYILVNSKRRQHHKKFSENHNFFNELPSRDIYSETSSRLRPVKPVYLSPVLKRRRLTACKQPTVIDSIYPLSRERQVNNDAIFESFNASDTTVCVKSRQPPSKASTSSSVKDSFDGSSDNTYSLNCLDTANAKEVTLSDDKSHSKVLIDLNVPPDTDANGAFCIEASDIQHDGKIIDEISSENVKDLQTLDQSKSVAFDQPTTSSRRQGTRCRPPTTRVLESLESGFFGSRKRTPSSCMPPQSSRRRRISNKAPHSHHSRIQDNISNGVVGMRSENMENDSLVGQPVDPTCVSKPEMIMDHSGLMYKFLNQPQTSSHENWTKDHMS